jgi:hypothetical protein
MKESALKGIAALEREKREIESELKKLHTRLNRIQATFDSVTRLLTGKVQAKKNQKPKSKTSYVDPHSNVGKLLAMLRDDGRPMSREKLAKALFNTNTPSQKELNMVSNTVIHLINRGMAVRHNRGVFRIHESHRKPLETKAEIGSDTRVEQISSSAH